MKSLRILLLFGVACKAPSPYWALDEVFLAPTVEGTVGSISWAIYDERWSKKFSDRHYICAVIVGFDTRPSAADCEACVVAFDLESELTDSDCTEDLGDLELFTSMRRLGIAGPATDGPFEQASSTAWADYGGGWEPYGWAFPEAVANGQNAGSFNWDGTEPFSFTPSAAWQMGQSSSGLAPVSRSPPPSESWRY